MTSGTALWIDPYTHHFEGDRLFSEREGPPHGDDYAGPWRHLRRELAVRGLPVHTADLLERGALPPARLNLYVSLGLRTRYPRLVSRPNVVASAFFAFECPVVEPRLYQALPRLGQVFRRLFSFSTRDALEPFVEGLPALNRFRLPQPYDRVHESIWARRERGFLVMINANKLPRVKRQELYTERLKALAFFEQHDEVDLYGMGWNGPPYRVGETRVPSLGRRAGHRIRSLLDDLSGPRDPLLAAARRAFRGPAATKADTLGAYTFALCFENMILDGWVTEKLFDCLLAGTVPVYWGAPDVQVWVPPECFIDMRRFADYRELRSFLHGLSPKEVAAYREAGRAYLESERFHPFSKAALADIFVSLVEQDGDA